MCNYIIITVQADEFLHRLHELHYLADGAGSRNAMDVSFGSTGSALILPWFFRRVRISTIIIIASFPGVFLSQDKNIIMSRRRKRIGRGWGGGGGGGGSCKRGCLHSYEHTSSLIMWDLIISASTSTLYTVFFNSVQVISIHFGLHIGHKEVQSVTKKAFDCNFTTLHIPADIFVQDCKVLKKVNTPS